MAEEEKTNTEDDGFISAASDASLQVMTGHKIENGELQKLAPIVDRKASSPWVEGFRPAGQS